MDSLTYESSWFSDDELLLLADALVDILNDINRANALQLLAHIKYKYRELAPVRLESGNIRVELMKKGAEYKSRHRAKSFPAIRYDEAVEAFNLALAPTYEVVTITDATRSILLYLRRRI